MKTIPGLVIPVATLFFIVWLLKEIGEPPWSVVAAFGLAAVPAVLGLCCTVSGLCGKTTPALKKTTLIAFMAGSLVISLLGGCTITGFFGQMDVMLNLFRAEHPIIVVVVLAAAGALIAMNYFPVMHLYKNNDSIPIRCCVAWMEIYMILAGSATLILVLMRLMPY